MGSQANASTDALVPFGRYLLERRLAVGGMAEVFLARLPGPNAFTKRVVIKRLLEHYATDDDAVALFLDEAKLAARFSHPNLVQVYELSQINGQYCTVMEYLEGTDLADLLTACARGRTVVPPPIAALLVASAAEALDYAHRLVSDDGEPMAIVHADVSPGNIVLTRQGEVKVVDFGIAQHAGATPREGVVRGKLSYMAPEHIRGRPIDARADVYALGVVLIELLTATPFMGGRNASVMTDEDLAAHIDEKLTAAKLDAHIEAVLRGALMPRAGERTASASIVHRGLEAYLATVQRPMASDVARFAAEVLPFARAGDPHPRTVALSGAKAVSGQFTDPRVAMRPETVALLVSGAPDGPVDSPRAPQRRLRVYAALAVCVAACVVALWARGPGTTPSADDESDAKVQARAIEPSAVAVDVIAAPDSASSQPVIAQPAAAAPSRKDILKSAKADRKSRRPAVAARPAPAPVVPAAAAPTLAPLANGKVAFLVDPWAEVYLGSRHLGTTPMAPVSLPEGRHEFRLVSPDTGREKTVVATVLPDKTIKVVESLR